MVFRLSLLTPLATGLAVLATTLLTPGSGRAAEFGQMSIPPELAIAIATPVRGGTFHNLMILTQVPQGRQCWQEQGSSPVRVDPLLLNFDFTGSCDRQTDGNGYSLRVNNEDLGVSYRLEISTRQSDLVLLARPIRDRRLPILEIGHTQGRQPGFLKVQLYPGWQLTRRTYNSQPVGHIYLSHDQPLNLAAATAPVPPSRPQPPSPPTADAPYFRVVVAMVNGDTLQQVRTVAPESFVTTIEGQSVVQVGLFQERQRAEDIYQALVAASLPAQILAASPSIPPVQPPLPQGRLLVVIDPGHGGRDPGAIGIGGVQEKDINTILGNRVRSQLEAAGITVLMTRSDDRWVDLEARAEIANQAGAAVFVSIHANAISMQRPEINGLETYYLSTGDRLAQLIHASILRNTDLANRGIRQARFYVLRHTTMPSVLVETGYLTGAVDAARFRNPAAVRQIADAIARGILDFLGR
ncbi:MAG: N-acetylmuramoyl-L-alanine amidase [Cyanobacteria bacterium REEB459]|nr:N-acetylmuramoyl-L-alanine amidase [Cyanobacteria bacterium REEB459]